MSFCDWSLFFETSGGLDAKICDQVLHSLRTTMIIQMFKLHDKRDRRKKLQLHDEIVSFTWVITTTNEQNTLVTWQFERDRRLKLLTSATWRNCFFYLGNNNNQRTQHTRRLPVRTKLLTAATWRLIVHSNGG